MLSFEGKISWLEGVHGMHSVASERITELDLALGGTVGLVYLFSQRLDIEARDKVALVE